MDFDNRKVYGDTFISDDLVLDWPRPPLFTESKKTVFLRLPLVHKHSQQTYTIITGGVYQLLDNAIGFDFIYLTC